MTCAICEKRTRGRSFACARCDQPACKNCRDQITGDWIAMRRKSDMADHTQGRLTTSEDDLLGVIYDECRPQLIRSEAGDLLIVAAVYPDSERPKLRHEDARRLVAAWNACEGIPTEELERLSVAALRTKVESLTRQGGL